MSKFLDAISARGLGSARRYMMPLASLFYLICLLLTVLGLYVKITEGYPRGTIRQVDPSMRVANIPTDAPAGSGAETKLRLFLIVVDALGYRFVSEQGGVFGFVNQPDIAKDAKLYKSAAQLPTMSYPNWVSLFTGVPPEGSGILGNDNNPPARHDTLQQRVSDAGRTMVFSGYDWWGKIQYPNPNGVQNKTAYPSKRSDCGNVRHQCDDHFDVENTDFTMQFLGTDKQPDLLMEYFVNVDSLGHAFGAASADYAGALNDTANHFRRLFAAVQEDTVVILTADHGQVGQGGHGGNSNKIVDIPVWVYRKNSGLATAGMDAAIPQFYESVGSATTSLDTNVLICSVLGLPIPRESMGVLPKDALSVTQVGMSPDQAKLNTAWKYYALAAQKDALARSFNAQYGKTMTASNLDAPPSTLGASNIDTVMTTYANSIQASMSSMASTRQAQLNSELLRNALVCFLVGLLVFLPLLLLTWYWSWDDVRHWVLGTDGKTALGPLESQTAGVRVMTRATQKQSIQHAVWGFVAAGLCVAITLIVWRIVYVFYRNVDGDWLFDQTIFNSIYDAAVHAMLLMIPAVIVALIAVLLGFFLTKVNGQIDNGARHLYMTSGSLAANIAALGCLIADYPSGIFIPQIAPIYFVDSFVHTTGFRCLTVAAGLVPIVLIFGISQACTAGMLKNGVALEDLNDQFGDASKDISVNQTVYSQQGQPAN